MRANAKAPMLHNEGLDTRNYTSYNFEVLRDDVYMLGVDGTVTGNRIAPTRSTCAVVVSSQNANRDWLYYMQQTVSAEGLSGSCVKSRSRCLTTCVVGFVGLLTGRFGAAAGH